MTTSLSRKLLPPESLIQRLGRPRDGALVFTNGCFDILHRGHVEYLAFARSLGDELLVALNSDASVRRLKGEGRPINTVEDRAAVLAGLEAVDWLTIFDADTPGELISSLLPDVLVKGGDYTPGTVVGAPEVEAAGGRVIIAPLVPGRSTTNIIRKVEAADK